MNQKNFPRISFILLLLSAMALPLQAQLKEFKLEELPKPSGIDVYADYADYAAVFIYSSRSDLTISGNLGIVADRSTPAEGKYRVFVLTGMRQILSVNAPGFKELKIPLPLMSVQETKYYQIEELITDGTLSINSLPEGAELLVNGTQYGFTPWEGPFPEGDYEIVLRKDLYHEKIEQVKVVADTTMSYTFRLRPAFGTLSLNSQPAGVEIFLDDNLVGTTPLTIEKVPSGEHEVFARKNFYEDVFKVYVIEDGQTLTDNLIMPKTEAALNLERRQRWKSFRKITLYSSAATGSAALALKFLADSKFEAYSNASTTAEATDLRKQTENFDLYTQISAVSCGLFLAWTGLNHFQLSRIPEPESPSQLSSSSTPTHNSTALLPPIQLSLSPVLTPRSAALSASIHF